VARKMTVTAHGATTLAETQVSAVRMRTTPIGRRRRKNIAARPIRPTAASTPTMTRARSRVMSCGSP